jgi:hypothetical protein
MEVKMATWTDLTFAALEVLAASKLNQMDANFDALAEGASGAPDITKIDDTCQFNAAVTLYYSMGSRDFRGQAGDTNYNDAIGSVRCGDTSSVILCAPVHLPNGAIITSFKAWWYRDDAAASGTIYLGRGDGTGGSSTMADASSDSTAGNHSVEDTTISTATVDNTAYHYSITCTLNPNDNTADVYLYMVVITYTTTYPRP